MPVKKISKTKKVTKRKTTKNKPLKKKPIKKRIVVKKVVKKIGKKESAIGVATHYFPKVRAAVIKLNKPLSVGDTIKLKGHTTDFVQEVTSIQIDHVPINQGKKGQEVGLLVNSRVRQHDKVYRP